MHLLGSGKKVSQFTISLVRWLSDKVMKVGGWSDHDNCTGCYKSIKALERRHRATRTGHHWDRGGHKLLMHIQLSGPHINEYQFSPQSRQCAEYQSKADGWESL